jgi:hypothetical protein
MDGNIGSMIRNLPICAHIGEEGNTLLWLKKKTMDDDAMGCNPIPNPRI